MLFRRQLLLEDALLFVTVAGGYMLVPGQIETLRGWRANLGLNLTLW
jgi:hypothetical protein